MFELFAINLLPVFLVAGSGYALAARTGLDPQPVTRVAFFILAPCFVFQTLVDGQVQGEALARLVGFSFAVLLGVAGVAALMAWLAGWSRSMIAALILVVMLPNAGNYGLSVSRFAFGEAGLAHAGVFFVTASVLTFTLGLFVASLGRSGMVRALRSLLGVPALWAVVAALILINTGWSIPFPLQRAIGLLAAGCIPVFLVILGLQLHGKGVRAPWKPLAFASFMRLVGGAGAGLALSWCFGLEEPARQAGVLQAAMPSAVITIIVAAQYDVEPEFVTSVVVVTTVLSPLTLTPLLAWI